MNECMSDVCYGKMTLNACIVELIQINMVEQSPSVERTIVNTVNTSE